jgi:hypothetical protein
MKTKMQQLKLSIRNLETKINTKDWEIIFGTRESTNSV